MLTLLDGLVERIAELAEGGQGPAQAAAPASAGRGVAPAAAPAGGGALPLTGRNQPMIPAIDWDWDEADSGQIAPEQFSFADAIPQSVAAGSEFAASSGSFSQNYRLFLNMIDEATFPAPADLAKARQLIAEPSGSPAEGGAPPGWVRIDSAGILRWAPDWSTSDSCERWTLRARTDARQPPVTITIPLSNGQAAGSLIAERNAPGRAASNAPGSAAAVLAGFETLSVTATAWGKIIFSPGAWFTSGMIALGKAYVQKPFVFFGPAGLLRGRVSAFYVGLDVSFSLSGQSALSESGRQSISADPELQIMGVAVTLDRSLSSLDAATPELTYRQSQSTPQIVAAEIEVFSKD